MAISKEFASLQFPNVSFGTHRVSCLSTAACNRTQEKYGKAPYVQEFEGFGANADLYPVLTDLKKLRDLHVERLAARFLIPSLLSSGLIQVRKKREEPERPSSSLF